MDAFPAGLGRRSDLDAELAQLRDPDMTGARVVAQHRGAWVIATGGDPPRLATARGRLRDDDGGPPVTGDWVAVDAAGAIAAVLERRGAIVRRAAGRPSRPQVLAANVDLALITEPLPDPHDRRAERLAALASAGGVPAALVLTKADLAEDANQRAARLARRLGLADAVAVSTLAEGAGVGVLQRCSGRARLPCCSARPGRGSRHSSTRCSAKHGKRSARSGRATGAAGTRRSCAS